MWRFVKNKLSDYNTPLLSAKQVLTGNVQQACEVTDVPTCDTVFSLWHQTKLVLSIINNPSSKTIS